VKSRDHLRLGGRSSPAISPALNRLRGRSEGEKELARYLAGLESRGALSERPTMTLELHRDRLGEINLRYGSITVRALREFYGSFAPHCADSEKLSGVLADLDEASLTQLVRDFKT
jgi:hypothetical protein